MTPPVRFLALLCSLFAVLAGAPRADAETRNWLLGRWGIGSAEACAREVRHFMDSEIKTTRLEDEAETTETEPSVFYEVVGPRLVIYAFDRKPDLDHEDTVRVRRLAEDRAERTWRGHDAAKGSDVEHVEVLVRCAEED